MSNVLVNDLYLSDIADAIREKLDTEDTYKPSEMANAIESISGGGITPTGTKSITANGTYDVTSYASANVNVPSGGATLQAKTNINPTTSSQTITADSGYDGLSSVQINAMPTQTLPSSASDSATGTQKAVIGKSTSARYLNIPTGYNGTAQYYQLLGMDLQSLNVTENGTYSASTYDLDGFSSVTVNVSGGGGSTGYDIDSGDFYALCDKFATDHGFTKVPITIASDLTDYYTVTHNLGTTPTECFLYPVNLQASTSGYQLGYTHGGKFGQDNSGNRTYTYFTDAHSAGYLVDKTFISLLGSINRNSYNFARNATATTVDIRGGTNSSTKLLAGSYILAVK